MPTFNSCRCCKSYTGLLRCAAFPKGIPVSIVAEGEAHDHVLPGQEGEFIFSPDKTPENEAQDAAITAQEQAPQPAGRVSKPGSSKEAKKSLNDASSDVVEKSLTGAMKPGHKYLRREAKAGGGYKYWYLTEEGHEVEGAEPDSKTPKVSLGFIDCGEKDTKARRITNVSTKQATITAQEIEDGVTLERLNDIGVPVFRYKTQVTIHGKLPDFNPDVKVNDYRWVFKNANGSIGIRYGAIDAAKKRTMMACESIAARRKNAKVSASMDSQGLILGKWFMEKEDALAALGEMNKLSGLFYGCLLYTSPSPRDS